MGDLPIRIHWARASLTGMVLGIAVTIVAATWMLVAKPSSVWSPEQAAEFKAANNAYHSAISLDSSSRGTARADNDPRYLAAARARLDRIGGQLQQARAARDHWGKWGVAAGLTLTIACGLGYLAQQSR